MGLSAKPHQVPTTFFCEEPWVWALIPREEPVTIARCLFFVI